MTLVLRSAELHSAGAALRSDVDVVWRRTAPTRRHDATTRVVDRRRRRVGLQLPHDAAAAAGVRRQDAAATAAAAP